MRNALIQIVQDAIFKRKCRGNNHENISLITRDTKHENTCFNFQMSTKTYIRIVVFQESINKMVCEHGF